MHRNSKLLFEKYAQGHFSPAAKVLEIGPDVSPSSYRAIVDPKQERMWDTVDFPRNFTTTFTLTNEYSFPIESDAYDLVLSGQVIEHVRKIWVWMKEVARVCKPGGLIVTIGPVSWPYHEAPIDCWRIYPEGMKALCDDAGLEVLTCTTESLEAKEFNFTIPGRSPEWQDNFTRRVFRILDKVRFPVECAYDTITIARKRS